jgi:hypothetical protein
LIAGNAGRVIKARLQSSSSGFEAPLVAGIGAEFAFKNLKVRSQEMLDRDTLRRVNILTLDKRALFLFFYSSLSAAPP